MEVGRGRVSGFGEWGFEGEIMREGRDELRLSPTLIRSSQFVKDGVGIFARSGKYHVRDIGGEKVDVKGVEDFLGVGEIYEKKEEDLGKKMLEDLLKGGEVEEEKEKVRRIWIDRPVSRLLISNEARRSLRVGRR